METNLSVTTATLLLAQKNFVSRSNSSFIFNYGKDSSKMSSSGGKDPQGTNSEMKAPEDMHSHSNGACADEKCNGHKNPPIFEAIKAGYVFIFVEIPLLVVTGDHSTMT